MIARATARVRPAPRNPAPTGLIREWCSPLLLVAARCKAAHPRSWSFLHTLHHEAVELITRGYENPVRNVA